jgi:ATP-dependent protease HslVU (ClpYQ) peptidase subunit
MTAIVGVLCQDGVVIGADSSATSVSTLGPTIEQEVKKIDILDGRVIVAGTGPVGLGQRFFAKLQDFHYKNKYKSKPAIEIAKQYCRLGIDDFIETKVQPRQYGALVAFSVETHFHLVEFAIEDFQPEIKTDRTWFVSMGSGQAITDPFLALLRKVFWKDAPPLLNEGVFAVAWTLQQAILLNPGGINGPQQIAVLKPRTQEHDCQARLLQDDEIDEHLGSVRAAEEHLGRYKELLQGKRMDRALGIPQPPAEAQKE